MSEQRERKADLLSGIGWIVFGGVIFVHAMMMETREYLGATFTTGPGFVPGLIGIAIAILGIAMVLRSLRGQVLAYFDDVDGHAGRRVAMALALLLVYGVGMIGRMPFWLATALFVTSFTFVFNLPVRGTRELVLTFGKAALTGVLTAAAVSYIFQTVFLIRLP